MIERGLSDIPRQTERLEQNQVSPTQEYDFLFNTFFGFRERPFNNTPDPDFFYMSSRHRDALVNMLFGVDQRKGFIAISGEIGAGKTTLCRHFLRQLWPDIKTAVVLNPEVSSTCLLASIAKDFGIQNQGHAKEDYFEAIHRFLLEGLVTNQNACLIIDEAQRMTVQLLEELRLLSNFETTKHKLIQIILVGQPELKDLLMRPELIQLRQRIGVFSHLRGLDFNETRAYIQHRLNVASLETCRVVFEDSVVRDIHRISGGIPRLINSICDRGLMAAYFQGTKRIDAACAERAFEEMELPCAT